MNQYREGTGSRGATIVSPNQCETLDTTGKFRSIAIFAAANRFPDRFACHNVGDILAKSAFAPLLKVYQIVLQLDQKHLSNIDSI